MNKNKCRCECKELIDEGVYDKEFIFNPSNCECECDKSCGVGEYLDYSTCKCREKLVDPLVEECTKNIEEAKLVKKALFCIFFIFFIISIGISVHFVCCKYANCNKYNLPY